MEDPFQFVASLVEKPVEVALLHGSGAEKAKGEEVVVRGILLSVDDCCNILLKDWSCSDDTHVTPHHSGDLEPPPSKKSRGQGRAAGQDRSGEVSLRLIRGSQIKTISSVD